MTSRRLVPSLLLAALAAAGCRSLGNDELAAAAPPLTDMEEPLPLRAEPDDEAARRALPLGSFTGVVATDARATLAEIGDGSGARVQRVVENSPGDAAGIEEDDLLLEARIGTGPVRVLRWASEWRSVEIDAPPGSDITILLDRAGSEVRAVVRTVARVRPTERSGTERFREERRAGVVVRTATEAEARGAGLGPGGGAVVVGLSRASPWRGAGIRYGDVLTSIDDRPIGHPQDLLEGVRNAPEDATVVLGVVREGAAIRVDAPLTVRSRSLHEVHVPLVFSYEAARGESEWSVLLGLVRRRATAVAWEWRILWLFTLRGGDADRLEELDV